jgi:peroxiredoxin
VVVVVVHVWVSIDQYISKCLSRRNAASENTLIFPVYREFSRDQPYSLSPDFHPKANFTTPNIHPLITMSSASEPSQLAHNPELNRELSEEHASAYFRKHGNLHVGDPWVHFDLLDAYDSPLSSIDLLATGPLIVQFFSGGSLGHLTSLQKDLSEYRRYGASVVIITPSKDQLDPIRHAGISFPIVVDSDAKFARSIGVADDNAYHSTTFVIKQNGQIGSTDTPRNAAEIILDLDGHCRGFCG